MIKNIEESIFETLSKNVITPKQYSVKPVDRREINDFIEKWHYSHNVNGLQSDFCFGLYFNYENKEYLIGACIYGKLSMANVWKKYSENIEDVIELKRLVLVDSAVRNSESYFIGKTIKWLTKNTTIKLIVSYADNYYHHKGIIYKASNFTYIGQTAKSKKIEYNGKLYHDKTIRNKYKGELKPYARKIKDALENKQAKYIDMPTKNIYIYNIRR